MKKVEKEYQKRFSNRKEYGSDIDVEGLWSKISTSVQPKKKDKRRFLLYFLFGLSAIGIGAILYNQSLFIDSDELNSIDDLKEVISIDVPDRKSNIENENDLASTKVQKNKTNTIAISEGIKEEGSVLFSTAEKSKISNKLAFDITHDVKQEFRESDKGESNYSMSQKPNIKTIHTNENPILEISQNTSLNADSSSSSKRDIRKESNIPLLDNEPLAYLKNEFNENRIEESMATIGITNIKDNQVVDNKKMTVNLYGGVNLLSNHYAPDSIDKVKNDSEKSIFGKTFGVSLSRPIYKNIHGSVAIEYNDLWTKFEVDKSETIQFLAENTLTHVRIDGQTLDTLDTVVGDTLVNAQYDRRVVHHNNVKTISIPLTIGYQSDFGRLGYGFYAGIAYNLRIHQSGKGLDNRGDILEYNNDTSVKPFDRSSIAFRFNPQFRYRYDNGISLLLSPQYQFSVGKHYGDADHSVVSSIWNINVGISKTF